MVATLDLDREPPTRLALGLRYIGHSLHGMQSGPDEVEKVRPSISGVVVAAARRAWGDVITRATAPRAAVRTEKRASARHNILVLTLKHGIVFEPDEAALKRELPDGIELIRVRVIPPHSGLQDVWYAVKRQSHAALVPYSALIRTQSSEEDETAAEEGSSSGTSSEGVVTPSSSSSSLWLSGLPDGCNESDVRALVEANASADDATITMPECGGFAQIGPLRPLSLQCLLDALDGFVWRGSTLLALRGDEAAEKLRVHQRIKSVLRQLSTGKHFINFVDSKGGVRQYGRQAAAAFVVRRAHRRAPSTRGTRMRRVANE